MSTAVSLELTDDQIRRLDNVAKKEQRGRPEMAARLVELSLRLSEFPHVVLRDFGIGPEAFISGTRLRVWWVATLIRDYEGDIAKTAEHLNLTEAEIQEVQRYAERYPADIEAAVAENDRAHDELKRAYPNLDAIAVALSENDASAP